MSTLDNILSGGGDAVPAQETNKDEQNVAQAAGEADGQAEQQAEGDDEGKQRMVPHEALHAEKQKVKRYTEQVASFEQRLNETNAAWERRMAQLVEAVKPKQEPPAPTDFFTDPDAAFNERLKASLEQTMGPVQGQLMAQAQMLAGIKYGDDKVQEAEQAFITALQSNKLDPADYQRVVNSPNRYAAAAEWHKRQIAAQEIGDDPAAYKAKLEAEIRAQVLAEVNGGNGQQTQQRQASVTPSNLAGARNVGARSGPAWSGPAPIGDIFNRIRAEQ